jgi:LysR family transcriptional regulator, hypochlorite-specific transcription factor HypT
MQIKWLEDFITLSQTRSFSKAAELRHVTHPAFGRRIKALEQWLGAALIDRSAYPTTLTVAGDDFLMTAYDICKQLTESQHRLGDQRLNQSKVLRVATGRTLGATLFPQWLISQKTVLGKASIDIWSGSLHDAIVRLEQQHCDLVFCYGHPSLGVALDPKKFASLTIGHETLIAVSAPKTDGSALFSLPGSVKNLVPILALAPELAMAKVLRAELPASLIAHTRTVYQADFADPLLPLVKAGLGVAWLPKALIETELALRHIVRAASAEFDVVCQVQIFRSLGQCNELIDQLWDRAKEGFAI